LDAHYRFSGHQTFPLRIAWIPKAVAAIADGRDPLSDVDEGITAMGLGKNMVEALRCWIEAFHVATRVDGWVLTPIGYEVFRPGSGLDPYLEDTTTCWLLHWLICTNPKAPFFAWECLFNRWPTTEFSATPVLDAFRNESSRNPKPVSDVTLRQHWEVFVHSYRSARGVRAEDRLDTALSLLGLIHEVGERQTAAGKWEPLYAFDTRPKRSIPQQLFTFFLHEWWNRAFPAEQTVPLLELVAGDRSIGRILKMQEAEILSRVTDLARHKSSAFQIVESTNIRQLRRVRSSSGHDCLRAAYKSPRFI
jgi:hypothetical protein